MDPGIMIPLAAFALAAIIVALTQTIKIHEFEAETGYRLAREELAHRTKMQELERELARLKRES